MSSANSSLRPAWHRGNQSGRGFQPPPTVASERSRSQSIGSEPRDSVPSSNSNKFAALDDDEDMVTDGSNAKNEEPKENSRSEALRPGPGLGGRNSSTSSSKGPSGRSLADLAARVPERPRVVPAHAPETAVTTTAAPSVDAPVIKSEAKVIRYTRERLLSLRPSPLSAPPPHMKGIEGTVILSLEPQDPVCWDTFDAEEIWAAVPRERRPTAVKPAPGLREAPPEERRSTSRRDAGSGFSGRWQRGVALPPADQAKKAREKESDDPNDLWDDPAADAAAAFDFSAFGASLDDRSDAGRSDGRSDAGSTAGDAFDFDKMTEASRKLEEEMHGTRSRASSDATGDTELDEPPVIKVDPKRPLASTGTTIRSGSGDNVNVFEDFDDPAVEAEPEPAPIRSSDEDPSASSRLMKMIGVVKDEPLSSDFALGETPVTSAWGAPVPQSQEAKEGSVIPLNPWGGPIPDMTNNSDHQQQQQREMDMQVRLREAAEAEQKARELELRRLQQEQEEAQRRAVAQQQEQEMASRNVQAASHQAGVQSQVELVLVERISTILETSWGRADLMSVLSTLHTEDSRVIPLLNNVDALRALLLRNPRRISLRQDPALRAEMAVLLVTNAQWQQQQEQEARAQQEEMLRREQQRRMEEERKAAAARAQSDLRNFKVIPDAPWFYSDPQNNIQGPFRGEEMRQWLEAGYFKGNLPISQQNTGPFHALSALFPDLSLAFMARNDNSADEARLMQAEREEKERQESVDRAHAEARAREADERERLAKQAEAAERARERERKEASERERSAKEEIAADAKNANSGNGSSGNESSTQLKLMLGLSAQDGAAASNLDAPEEAPPAPKASEKRASKAANKNTQRASKEAQPSADTSSAASKSAPPAWGGAAVIQPVTKKSMSEIQNEEARAAAVNVTNQKGDRPSSGGWANVAASRGGSSAWSGATVIQTPAAVVTKPNAMAPTGIQSRSKAKVAAVDMEPSTSTQQRSSSNSSVAEEFGAKMSPALEKWCKDQMQILNGTEDLTLVSFCMTLRDPEEIRQYLTTYLGSTPPVNKFATEFISKKGGTKTQQEDWETSASTAKKARKKKAGGR
jgi:hypothetical protein